MSWKKIKTYRNDSYQSKDSDMKIFDKWVEGKDISTWSSSRYQNIPKYITIGKDTTGYKNSIINEPPYVDHVSIFKSSKNKKIWMTYQPYLLKSEIEKEIQDWVDEYGLIANVYESDKSWYSPNDTCLVVITTKWMWIIIKDVLFSDNNLCI